MCPGSTRVVRILGQLYLRAQLILLCTLDTFGYLPFVQLISQRFVQGDKSSLGRAIVGCKRNQSEDSGDSGRGDSHI
jgi:hypothetical protein